MLCQCLLQIKHKVENVSQNDPGWYVYYCTAASTGVPHPLTRFQQAQLRDSHQMDFFGNAGVPPASSAVWNLWPDEPRDVVSAGKIDVYLASPGFLASMALDNLLHSPHNRVQIRS